MGKRIIYQALIINTGFFKEYYLFTKELFILLVGLLGRDLCHPLCGYLEAWLLTHTFGTM